MARRFNYTNRKRITRDHAIVTLREDEQGLYFDVDLNLSSYGLDSQAHVFVEAYRRTDWMRFPYGRVGLLAAPPLDQRRLTQFDVPDGIQFRVKVTADGTARGQLLAEADGLRPRRPDQEPDNAIPLIDVCPDDLGAEIWRVDVDGNHVPRLLINRNIPGWRELVRELNFRALVTPAVMRQVLTYALIIDEENCDPDDPDDSLGRWIRFASSLPGVGDPPDDVSGDDITAVHEWINSAVESFSRRSGLFDRFLQTHSR